MITQDRLKQLLSYNPETGDFVWINSTSNRVAKGKIAGTLRKSGYRQIRIDGKIYLSHRLAWLYVYGKLPDNLIDHISGWKADNRIVNLRKCTYSENSQNKRLSSNRGITGYLGVCFHKLKEKVKFRAEINISGKGKHLGVFDSAEEAYSAYIEAKRKYHPFNTL